MEPVDFSCEADIFNTALFALLILLFHSAWLFVHQNKANVGRSCSSKYHIRTRNVCFLTSDLPHCHCPDYQQRPEWLHRGSFDPFGPGHGWNRHSLWAANSWTRVHHSAWYMLVPVFSITEHGFVLTAQCLVKYQYQASLANHVIIGFQNNLKVSSWSQPFYPSSTCASASLNALPS